MEAQRVVISEPTEGKVSKVYRTVDNKFYYIGYENGILERRSSINLKIEKSYSDLGHIKEILSDDETYMVVANKEG